MKIGRSGQKGQRSTLVACFLHFDLSFMLWVLLGALGIFIAESLHLNKAAQAELKRIALSLVKDADTAKSPSDSTRLRALAGILEHPSA